MPFIEVDISKIIQEKGNNDPEFNQAFNHAVIELDTIAQDIKHWTEYLNSLGDDILLKPKARRMQFMKIFHNYIVGRYNGFKFKGG